MGEGEGARAGAAVEVAGPVYDQAFFLDLARPRPGETHDEVRERWNTWRRDPANARVTVTFEGVDFDTEENLGISFAGFEFGNGAKFNYITSHRNIDFSASIFGSNAYFSESNLSVNFSGAKFIYGANFGCTKFVGSAIFNETLFGDSASFRDSLFCDGAWFRGSIFGDSLVFAGANFDSSPVFTGSIFGEFASFKAVKFGDFASFSGAVFGIGANFSDSIFGCSSDFFSVTFGRLAHFDRVVFGAFARFSGGPGDGDVSAQLRRYSDFDEVLLNREIEYYRYCRENDHIGPSSFSDISFQSSIFKGGANFSNRSFAGNVDFSNCFFFDVPKFYASSNIYCVNFSGSRIEFSSEFSIFRFFGWTTDATIAVRLRTLRSLIEATKNHDFERDLYIEERKAERGIFFRQYWEQKRFAALLGHCLWIAVMAIYWAFSNYGRSWLRPFLCLLAVLVVFRGIGPVDGIAGWALAERRGEIVVVAEGVGAGQGAAVGARYDDAVRLHAVANSIPFVGPLTVDGEVKRFLFCGPKPAEAAKASGASGVEAARRRVLLGRAAAEAAKPPLPSGAVGSADCVPLPPAGFQAATILQNLVSIVLVFFIGLALRNYFRLK